MGLAGGSTKKILIIEDEVVIRSSLRRLLTRNHYQVTEAGSVDEAMSHNLEAFDLIISDLRLPGDEGTTIISKTQTPVLIMTSFASMKSAVDSMKMGAVDYIAKPFDHKAMLASITDILTRVPIKTILGYENSAIDTSIETQKLSRTTLPNDKKLGKSSHSDNDNTDIDKTGTGMVGSCPSMLQLFRRIKKVAPTQATVLVRGESGTGKELVAKALHNFSIRRKFSMICVNCAAIPESLIESELFGHEKGAFTGANANRTGLVEAAHRGTLFLDEIGELPLEAQARLLRVLQEGEIRKIGSVQSKKVDVRLIAATHRNLKAMAQNRTFREDLYYRLNVVELYLPALRERGLDIIALANFLMEKICKRMNLKVKMLSSETQELLMCHPWPGNVRELENAIERAVILCDCDDDVVTPFLLGLETVAERIENIKPLNNLYSQSGALASKETLNKQNFVELDMKQAAGSSLENYFQQFVLGNQDRMNETQLAEKLGISRKCLWERRKRFGIQRNKQPV